MSKKEKLSNIVDEYILSKKRKVIRTKPKKFTEKDRKKLIITGITTIAIGAVLFTLKINPTITISSIVAMELGALLIILCRKKQNPIYSQINKDLNEFQKMIKFEETSINNFNLSTICQTIIDAYNNQYISKEEYDMLGQKVFFVRKYMLELYNKQTKKENSDNVGQRLIRKMQNLKIRNN